MMDYFSELIKNIVNGNLEFDSFNMNLIQNESANPIKISGKGYVRQEKEGSFRFKLFADLYSGTSPHDHLRRQMAASAGRLFAKDEYYTLRFQEKWSKEWIALRVLPDFSWDGEHLVAYGQIGSLESANPDDLRGAAHAIMMDFVSDIEIPYTSFSSTESEAGDFKVSGRELNFTEFSYEDMKFHVEQTDRGFSLSCSSDHRLPDHLEIRIVETLQFVFARPLRWLALIISNGEGRREILRPAMQISRNINLSPPIDTRPFNNRAMVWRLFCKYLTYVVKTGTAERPHPISVHLYDACEGSANSIDAWIVATCVSTEGIASHLHFDTSSEQIDEINAIKKIIGEFYSNSEHKGGAIRNRIDGFFPTLKRPRMQDRLQPLISSGKIRRDLLQSWKAVRHKNVHGSSFSSSEFDDGELQKVLLQIRSVMVLSYEIIFHLVGYEEDYTDYSILGWPNRSVQSRGEIRAGASEPIHGGLLSNGPPPPLVKEPKATFLSILLENVLESDQKH